MPNSPRRRQPAQPRQAPELWDRAAEPAGAHDFGDEHEAYEEVEPDRPKKKKRLLLEFASYHSYF